MASPALRPAFCIGIGVLSKHLSDANYEDVLARATHKSKRELEKLVAELAPKPDVPPTIRKRPQRNAKAAPSESSSELCPDSRVELHRHPATPAVSNPGAPTRGIATAWSLRLGCC